MAELKRLKPWVALLQHGEWLQRPVWHWLPEEARAVNGTLVTACTLTVPPTYPAFPKPTPGQAVCATCLGASRVRRR